MRGLFIAALLASSAALAQYAPQSAGSEPLAPELEARVQALGKRIRCATCQGMAISDSPASMARSQLDMVRALVAEGRTDEEVEQFFVERFGEWALLKPRADATTALLWAGPVLLLLGGLAFVVLYAAQHRAPVRAPVAPDSGAPEGDAAPPAGAPAEEDPYLAAVRAEMDR